MTSTPERSTCNMLKPRMKRCVKISMNTTRQLHRMNKKGRSRLHEQSLRSSQEISITWHRQRQCQVSIILHIRTSNLRRLTSTSKRILRAHSNRTINGSRQARRKSGSSAHWPKNSNKRINSSVSQLSEQPTSNRTCSLSAETTNGD